MASAWAPLATILAAAVAALVATYGYITSNRAKRNEVTASTFASALDAVEEYKNLPYRIRRRTSSDPATRAELGNRISDAQQKIRYYVGLLELEGPIVAEAYKELVKVVEKKGKEYRSQAWHLPPIDSDQGMSFTETFSYGDRAARARCLIAMTTRLGRGSPATRLQILRGGLP